MKQILGLFLESMVVFYPYSIDNVVLFNLARASSARFINYSNS